jgi:hypothetical protein
MARAEPAAKLALADGAIAAAPRVAALHYHRGRALEQLGRGNDAFAAFGAGLACAIPSPTSGRGSWSSSPCSSTAISVPRCSKKRARSAANLVRRGDRAPQRLIED